MRVHQRGSYSSQVLVEAWIVLMIATGCVGPGPAEPDRNDMDSVLWAFVDSLMRNEVEMTKSLTAPELWDRVDSWVAKHEALQGYICSWDPDDNRVFQDCAPCSHGGIAATCCDYNLFSTYEERLYHFAVKGVVLWKTEENGYEILAWDEICESKGGEDPRCD